MTWYENQCRTSLEVSRHSWNCFLCSCRNKTQTCNLKQYICEVAASSLPSVGIIWVIVRSVGRCRVFPRAVQLSHRLLPAWHVRHVKSLLSSASELLMVRSQCSAVLQQSMQTVKPQWKHVQWVLKRVVEQTSHSSRTPPTERFHETISTTITPTEHFHKTISHPRNTSMKKFHTHGTLLWNHFTHTERFYETISTTITPINKNTLPLSSQFSCHCAAAFHDLSRQVRQRKLH